MKKTPLIIISLLILVCLSSCGKKTITDAKSYSVNEISELNINASSWNVSLSIGSGDEVSVDITGSISKGEEIPSVSLSNGTLAILQVSEDSGKNEIAFGKKGQITVTIPSELAVPIEIDNGYGDMEINHIAVPQFLLNNEAGYVNFTNFKADMLQISSTSGDITISSSSIPDISVVSSSAENMCPKLDAYKPLIDQWLLDDRKAPRKQRHTAKRVFKRLLAESEGFDCSYRENNARLLETLKVYLESERNSTLTAQILKIHRSTLPYPDRDLCPVRKPFPLFSPESDSRIWKVWGSYKLCPL